MKKLLAFTKEKIVTGIIFIVPIAIICILLAGVIKELMAATAPLTDKMSLESPLIKTIIAIALVIIFLAVFFFIGGLFYKSYLGRRVNAWLEEKLLARIPFFKTLKTVTGEIAGANTKDRSIVEVDLYGTSNKVLALHTDTLEDGRFVVFVPFSPIINIGQVHIVASENVQVLDIPFASAANIISRIGFGAKDSF